MDDEFSEWSNILFDEFRKGLRIILLSDLTLSELEDATKSVKSILDLIDDENVERVFLTDESPTDESVGFILGNAGICFPFSPATKRWRSPKGIPADEARALSEEYLKNNVVGEKHIADTQHIAIASVERTDVLVSWNFKHIVNLDRIKAFNSVNMKSGYPLLEIRTPREVVHGERV